MFYYLLNGKSQMKVQLDAILQYASPNTIMMMNTACN